MRRPSAGDVVAYYAYKATTAVEFYRPVMYLYFLSQGLSFTQIATLEALYNLTTVLGEVPTGYVGDRIGRRNSLLLGTAVIATVLGGLGVADSFPAFAGLYVCWSLGYTFRSGSEDAWLYDTLSDRLSTDAFATVRGRGEAIALAMGVIGAVSGGYLGGIDLAYPFFVAAVVTAGGLLALLAMGEPGSAGDRDRRATLGPREAVVLIRDAVGRPDLRGFVLYYYVLFAAVTYLVFMFLQPVFETVVLDLGVPAGRVESLLGWFYGAYSLLGAVLSYNTGWIQDRIGLKGWFYTLPVAIGGGLVAMYFVPVLAIPVLLVARGVADTTRALAGQYVNDRIGSAARATVLSAMAMVSGLTVIPFQLGGGAISDLTSPTLALAIAGGVLAVAAGLLIAVVDPIGSPSASSGTG